MSERFSLISSQETPATDFLLTDRARTRESMREPANRTVWALWAHSRQSLQVPWGLHERCCEQERDWLSALGRYSPRAHNGYTCRGEVISGAQHGVPSPLGKRVSEAVAEIESRRMASFAISPPAAHRPGGQVCIDGHDVDLRVAKESVDDVLPGRPQPSFDDDTQLDTYSGRHQPGKSILKVNRKLLASRLAEDDRHRRRGIDNKAPRRRLRQRGRPASS